MRYSGSYPWPSFASTMPDSTRYLLDRPARRHWPLAVALVLTPMATDAAIYRCVTESGVIEYSNTTPDPARARDCQQLDLPQITTIPATPVPAPAPAPAAASPAKSAGASPAEQRRLEERMQILRDEFQRESRHLAELKAEYNGGQPERLGSERNYQKYLDRVERLKSEIERSESNLAALEREMDALLN